VQAAIERARRGYGASCDPVSSHGALSSQGECVQGIHAALDPEGRDEGLGISWALAWENCILHEGVVGDSGGESLNSNTKLRLFPNSFMDYVLNLSYERHIELPDNDPYYFDDEHFVKLMHYSTTRPKCLDPLENISYNHLNYEKLLQLEGDDKGSVIEALSWIRTDKLWDFAVQVKGHKLSRFNIMDTETLTSSRVLHLAPSVLEYSTKLFKVPKKGGKSRLIADCRDINDIMPPPGNMNLITHYSAMDMLLDCEWVIQFDGKIFLLPIPT
jgi:hypothetical protein